MRSRWLAGTAFEFLSPLPTCVRICSLSFPGLPWAGASHSPRVLVAGLNFATPKQSQPPPRMQWGRALRAPGGDKVADFLFGCLVNEVGDFVRWPFSPS